MQINPIAIYLKIKYPYRCVSINSYKMSLVRFNPAKVTSVLLVSPGNLMDVTGHSISHLSEHNVMIP